MKNSLISLVRNSVKVLVVVSFLGLTFGCEEAASPDLKINIEKNKNTDPIEKGPKPTQ